MVNKKPTFSTEEAVAFIKTATLEDLKELGSIVLSERDLYSQWDLRVLVTHSNLRKVQLNKASK